MSQSTEAGIAGALLAPDRPAPATVADARRFSVYRNNVVVGLVDALAATYPASLALVGEDFFRAAAREFVLDHPPTSPILIEYGAAFPAWIASFPPAAGVAYLGDVARLEWAWNCAYNSAEAVPLEMAILSSLPPEDLAASVVHLHPSIAILHSRFPFVSIWAQATTRVASEQLDMGHAETALVVRPEADVDVRTISPMLAGFLERLLAGGTIGQGAEALDGDQAALTECLVALFQLSLAVGLRPGGGPAEPGKHDRRSVG